MEPRRVANGAYSVPLVVPVDLKTGSLDFMFEGAVDLLLCVGETARKTISCTDRQFFQF